MPSSSTKLVQPTRTHETYLYNPVTPHADATPVGLMYPASYSIAMSSLGYLTLFQILDTNPDVAVQRVYSDTVQNHVGDGFELMGFSFAFELDVVAILDMLKVSGIPFSATDRERSHPLVFAGGPVPMSNPEPFAEFFDFFLIGEGEDMLNDLIQAYRRHQHIADRQTLLRTLARDVQGFYAPSLYDVEYAGSDGPITRITPKFDDVPAMVEKRLFGNMEDVVAATPILTENTVFANTFLVEVMRGCAHRCRFCLASYAMLPARGPDIQPIIDRIAVGVQHTKKIGLLGALISNHPNFDQLCDYLDGYDDLTISAASLRADTMTPQIANTFKKGGQNQLTIAVESGSERLRRRINKNLKHEDIIRATTIMADAGLKGVKLYGMVGLPDETDHDVELLAQLVKDIRKENPKLTIHLGTSSFVPKAGTPFQWQPKLDNKIIERRQTLLKKSLLKVPYTRVNVTSAKWDFFQAFLSRGDRRLAPLLVRFYELGGSLGSVNRAYKELKEEGRANFPELDWYALRERPESEVLPWEMINLGVPKAMLYKEGLPPAGLNNYQHGEFLTAQAPALVATP